MRTQRPGRHELGQNFLIDRNTIETVVKLVAATDGPVIEIGAGDGALTVPLQRLGRRLTAIELDDRRAARLAARVQPPTEIVTADFLRHPLPATPHVLVGNLPFHLTTAMLRRVLRAPGWTEAVLLVQWEVARRRAGVGGATMMTAQWWPWFDFRLVTRVSAAAFRPKPGVDGGLLMMTRRRRPLVAHADRERYQDFVQRVFTGRGRGIAEILAASRETRQWLKAEGVAPTALPKSLTARQWAEVFRLQRGNPARARGVSPNRTAPRR
ncbi:23S ribosomal RNA methyltransferase Erm [Amycolatopsis coloradensis]|uniref:23S ribosomal RNA methyltransferase Erm n=1 Tax=Amycolatopsis coloradensis TaxID=76021 RepID=A0A1R0L0R2_9PSEU|nr:23S ribosomal RNA methyltransferase Erm [Amycolatopsis coloradensis]OLZ55397.1 23S ribosomal RNA methyltransferase Erm [Amycolatopsis coloradensis]